MSSSPHPSLGTAAGIPSRLTRLSAVWLNVSSPSRSSTSPAAAVSITPSAAYACTLASGNWRASGSVRSARALVIAAARSSSSSARIRTPMPVARVNRARSAFAARTRAGSSSRIQTPIVALGRRVSVRVLAVSPPPLPPHAARTAAPIATASAAARRRAGRTTPRHSTARYPRRTPMPTIVAAGPYPRGRETVPQTATVPRRSRPRPGGGCLGSAHADRHPLPQRGVDGAADRERPAAREPAGVRQAIRGARPEAGAGDVVRDAARPRPADGVAAADAHRARREAVARARLADADVRRRRERDGRRCRQQKRQDDADHCDAKVPHAPSPVVDQLPAPTLTRARGTAQPAAPSGAPGGPHGAPGRDGAAAREIRSRASGHGRSRRAPLPRAAPLRRAGRPRPPRARAPRRGALPRLPAPVQGRPPRRPAGPLQGRPPRGRRVGVRALRRGELPTRLERLGDDLLRRLQPALRLLPEPRDLLATGRRAGERPPAGGDDARAAGDRLPQHQLGHARAR